MLVTYIGTIKLWIIVCYLIVYMFMALNFLMMLLERKLSQLETAKVFDEIFNLLSKEENPKDYWLARFYFLGSSIMLLGGVILLFYL